MNNTFTEYSDRVHEARASWHVIDRLNSRCGQRWPAGVVMRDDQRDAALIKSLVRDKARGYQIPSTERAFYGVRGL